MSDSETLESRLREVSSRMAGACERTGRDPASVRLLAVSKMHSEESVKELADLGVQLFGENRVQEAKGKIPQCPPHLEWHMIGHLQSNKCRDAVRFFSMIQGVDSYKIAEALNEEAGKAARSLPILIEVNVGGESAKFGYPPDRLLEELEALNDLPRLEIHGLMCIPPWGPDPEKSRPYFRRLRDLARRAEDRLGAPLTELSMGMSGDFEVAIEEGATLIRVGTALFGPRKRR